MNPRDYTFVWRTTVTAYDESDALKKALEDSVDGQTVEDNIQLESSTKVCSKCHTDDQLHDKRKNICEACSN